MSIHLDFIGWDCSFSMCVADRMLKDVEPPAVDLGHLLVVVPTRQAGRRLRDTMTLRASDKGAALLSLRVVSPTRMIDLKHYGGQIANGAEQIAAWCEALASVEKRDLSELFPAVVDDPDDEGWRIRFARQLIRLRGELADGGYCITDVAHGEFELAEPGRWLQMASLEDRYLDTLKRRGLSDVQIARMAMASSPVLVDEVQRVIVAGVSDPSLLTIRTLEALGARVDVDIWVQAPEALSGCFDKWGRPLPDAWEERLIPWEASHVDIHLAADPKAQAECCLDALGQYVAESGGDALAIGAPDAAVVPYIREIAEGRGVSCFDPKELMLADHPLCKAILLLLDLFEQGRYRDVANLLRHPDVVAAEPPGYEKGLAVLLGQLDRFQNAFLPLRLQDMLARFEDNSRGTDSKYDDFTELGEALSWLNTLRASLRQEGLAGQLRQFLQSLYEGRLLQPQSTRDSVFIAAAESLDGVLREFEVMAERGDEGADERDIMRVRLQESHYQPDRGDECADIEGWLELPWNDAPVMAVTGMNEGAVPDGKLSDVFLPDSLRRSLQLRDDRLRLARDAHALSCLCEQRQQTGKLILICGKTSQAGDPLKPSRLLFRCPDCGLVARASKLFGDVAKMKEASAATVSFRLDPVQALGGDSAKRLDTLSVTDFGGYLRCPFRFFLGRVLGMEPLDDRMHEPDHRVYGNMVHKALELLGSDRMLWGSDDTDRVGQALCDEYERLDRLQFGAHPPLNVVVARESAKQRLRRVAERQVRLHQEGWDLLFNEKQYEMQVGDLRVVGRIDRIDQHRETGQLRVLDYKTSDKANSPMKKHIDSWQEEAPDCARVDPPGKRSNARKRWIDLQLPLYREMLLANGVSGAASAQLGYFTIAKALSDVDVSLWHDYSDALHQQAVACAEGVVNAIGVGCFWPPLTPSNPDYDDFKCLLPASPEDCVAYDALTGGGA